MSENSEEIENELCLASELESEKLKGLRQAGSLCKAAGTRNYDRVASLLAKKVNPNVGDYDNRTALHIASSEGDLKIVELLVKHGANVNSQDRWGGTPLTDAVRYQHSEVVTFLKAHGATLDLDHVVAELSGKLLQLVASRQVAAAEELLKAASNPSSVVNSHDYDHRTPLHVAASEGSLELVQLLVKHGAQLEPTDRWGGTPLTDAIRHNHNQVANYLKDKGANVPEPVPDPIMMSVFSLLTRLLQLKDVKSEQKKEILFILDSIIQKYPRDSKKLITKMSSSQKKTLKKMMKEHYPGTDLNEDAEFEDFVCHILEKQMSMDDK